MYVERPAAIPGAVVWESISSGRSTRILPDGCIDVIWMDGRLVVAGADPTARMLASTSTGRRAVGLRFAPGQAVAALGVPADQLVGSVVDLAAVIGDADARRRLEHVASSADPGAVLEATFASRVATNDDGVRAAIVGALDRGWSVDAVADAAALSSRQLHRRALEWFGYGPQHLSRVLRFQRALASARLGRSLARAAADAGYADQAHLARDARTLALTSMSELLRG